MLLEDGNFYASMEIKIFSDNFVQTIIAPDSTVLRQFCLQTVLSSDNYGETVVSQTILSKTIPSCRRYLAPLLQK